MSLTFRRLTSLALTPVLLLAVPHRAWGQATSTSITTTIPSQVAQIPLSHLYSHFLLFAAHVQHMEELHPETAGRKGNFNELLRKKIGLSPEEWKLVCAGSLRFEKVHKTTLSQRSDLVRVNRAACESNQAACSAPPNLAILQDLESRHRDSLNSEIAKLETALAPASVLKLHTFLQTDVRSKIKLITPAQAAVTTQTVQAVSK